MRNPLPLLCLAALSAAAPAAAQQKRWEDDVWSDPVFRQRVVESHLSETAIEPEMDLDELELLQEILELRAADQPAAARKLLEKSRAAEGASARFDFMLAEFELEGGHDDAAVAALEAAIAKHPKFRRAWQNLGWIHFSRGDHARALPALTRTVELGGGSAITYGMMGFAHSGRRDFLAAESAFRLAILLDPGTLDWKRGLAYALFEQQRFAEASSLFGALIHAHPDQAEYWIGQANAYIGMQQPLRAAENLEFVDALGEATPDSLNLLGDIYATVESWGLAVDAYGRAVHADPAGSPERAVRAARELRLRGALPEAATLVALIEESYPRLGEPERKELLRIRAYVAVSRGEGGEEVRALEELVKLDPMDGEALMLLGNHAAAGGERERAMLYFERAARVEAFAADAKVRHAEMLVQLGRPADAVPLLQAAQRIRPRDGVGDYLRKVERAAKAAG